jgi:aminopeptidase N
MNSRLIIALLFISLTVFANDPYPKNNNIDIRHYLFQLEVNDSTDVLSGRASVTVLFKKSITEFELDLAGKSNNGKGMTVSRVSIQQQPLQFTHQNNRLKITLVNAPAAGEEQVIVIDYAGIPEDGLIIGKNKFNDRTFFGDNWPDRGHYWLPAIDHPSDKARVDFIIIAPEHYQVVATGKWMEESNLPKQRKLTHWKEAVDVPVKVMTIGIARFAVQLTGEPGGVPVTTWVYPQNREEGFVDFAVAPRVLAFFQQYIGPYSYEKLAHVQSKTRWGGLENASNIFYFENSVTGKNEHEGLIAHETAHQWFGNSASEKDWHHAWLSEGFATYFTDLYLEDAYGNERLVNELKKQRHEVTDYYKKNKGAIVDTTITDISKVLSTNTYQKAGWVLHMLRQEIGNEQFHKTIREYYAKYQNSNALTIDFQKIAEANAGRSLGFFFDQWLFKSGHPHLSCSWSFDAKTKEVVLRVDQIQNGIAFKTPLELGLNGTIHTVMLDKKNQQFRLPVAAAPKEMVLDPNTKLLFEGEIKGK